MTEQEQIATIYSYIQENVKWDETYGIYAYDELENCFAQKTAGSGELNLMFLALLRQMEVKSYPVLISTRSNGKTYPLYPFLDQFDHVIVAYYLKGEEQYRFADLSGGKQPLGYPSVAALNFQGMLIGEERTKWIDIKPPTSKAVFLVNGTLDVEGGFKGTLKSQLTGYMTPSVVEKKKKEQPEGEAESEAQANETSGISNILEELEFSEIQTIKNGVKGVAEFNLVEYAQGGGGFLYFSPLNFYQITENPLKAEKRQYPVDMPYNIHQHYIFVIETPEGYAVEELPEGANVILPNKDGKLTYSAKTLGEKIQITLQVQVNKNFFLPDEYPYLKAFFDAIIQKQEEQIVLKSKT